MRALIAERIFFEVLDDSEGLEKAVDQISEGLSAKLRQRWKVHHDRAGSYLGFVALASIKLCRSKIL